MRITKKLDCHYHHEWVQYRFITAMVKIGIILTNWSVHIVKAMVNNGKLFVKNYGNGNGKMDIMGAGCGVHILMATEISVAVAAAV